MVHVIENIAGFFKRVTLAKKHACLKKKNLKRKIFLKIHVFCDEMFDLLFYIFDPFYSIVVI